MPVAAFPHDTERSIPERTIEIDGATINALDLIAWAGAFGAVLLPGVVIPAGQTPSGLPVGVQIVGPYLQDRRLLQIAEPASTRSARVPPPAGLLSMRFIIYGAGAIGGAIGGRLAEAGHDVVLIARGANHDALQRDGLQLESPGRTVSLAIPVVDHPAELDHLDRRRRDRHARDVRVDLVDRRRDPAPGVAEADPGLLAGQVEGLLGLLRVAGSVSWACAPSARRRASSAACSAARRAFSKIPIVGSLNGPAALLGHVACGSGQEYRNRRARVQEGSCVGAPAGTGPGATK